MTRKADIKQIQKEYFKNLLVEENEEEVDTQNNGIDMDESRDIHK